MVLRARNRELVGSQTQIATAPSASAIALVVDSTVGFNANDFIVIGTPGEDTCEIKRITAITNSTTFAVTALAYAHLVDEPVQFTPYDQIEFAERETSGGANNVITTKTMVYEDGAYTTYDYPTASTSNYYVYRYYNSNSGNFSAYSTEYQIPTYYCSVEDIEDLSMLVTENDLDLNYNQVLKMISFVTKEIDEETNTSWTTRTATQEYFDGSGHVGTDYFLEEGPIISMTTLQTTQNDEDVDSASLTWDTLTENDDYFMDKATSRISITAESKNPNRGRNRGRATYTYGHATISNDIRRLATLMVIRDLAKMNAMKSVVKGHSEFNNFSYTAVDKEIAKLIMRNTREKQYNSN